MNEYCTILMFLNPLGWLGTVSPAQGLSNPLAIDFVCQFPMLSHCSFLKAKNSSSQCSWRYSQMSGGWEVDGGQGVALGKLKVH